MINRWMRSALRHTEAGVAAGGVEVTDTLHAAELDQTCGSRPKPPAASHLITTATDIDTLVQAETWVPRHVF